jgi:two-component system response regulator PhoP
VQLGIVDLGLPDRSGVELISRLRASGCEFPILILTAREHWQDKVNGLNAGGDDYVVKPFNLDELKARINALMRRTAGQAQPILRAGPVEMNTHAREVRVEGRVVALTAYEYHSEMLVMRAGRVVSKQELRISSMTRISSDSNVVEVLLTRLRKKLDPDRSRDHRNGASQGYRMPRAPDGGD